MEQYEIRIVAEAGERREFCRQFSDHAAIRRARSLAGRMGRIEVWRAQSCIYAQAPEAVYADV